MHTKIVYQLDSDGIYVGPACADESPLEAGVFLLPAGCIEEVPPEAIPGNRQRFVDGAWVLEPIPPLEVDPDAPIESLTKAQQIAAMLAAKGETRLLIQLTIEWAEDKARALAPSYGLTAEQALAYAYDHNKSYRECKDLEAAIRAIEVAP